MTRKAIGGLATVLVIWALINTFVIHAYGRHAELYPMTAWQMFSGRPKTFVRHFVFEIVPRRGDAAVEVAGGELIGVSPRSTRERRILQGVWRSHDYGCPDYRLSNYRECRDDPIQPWVIPKDIADAWVQGAMSRLGTDAPPYSITLIKVETPLGSDTGAPVEQRLEVLQWRPSSGSYQAEDKS